MARKADHAQKKWLAARLQQAYHDGQSVKDAASALGVSTTMAYATMKQYGVVLNKALYGRNSLPHLKRERNAAIVTEYTLVGTSKSDIARKYGISRQRVQQIIDHYEYVRDMSWTITIV